MKIKKDSWMVWMIDQAFEVKPKSLCTFFWALIGSIVLAPLAYPVVIYNLIVKFILKNRISTMHYGLGCIITLASVGFCGKYYQHYYLNQEYTLMDVLKHSPIWMLVIIGGVSAFIGMIFGIIYLAGILEDKAELKREKRNNDMLDKFSEPVAQKKPNVIIEFIKAKKQKVCPIIEYVED
ncbi:MAG: hypothetical protein V4547_18025 [Bacteroidota bacterium]